MNAYQKAIELELTGTDAEKVQVLHSLSQSNIDASKARLWLSDKGLLAYDGSAWFGTLEDATLSEQLTAGVRDLKARVLSGHPIRTAEKDHARKVLAIITGIAAAVPEIAGLVDQFYSLDGGRPYKDLTVQQFAAQRAEAIEQAEKQAVSQAAATLMNESVNPAIAVGDRATIVAALRNAANTLEAV